MHRVLRASDRPMAIHPAFTERPLHQQGQAINCRLTPDSDPFARLARTTSGFHRLLLQLQACAVCCCNLQLALAATPVCQTGGEPPTRIGCSTLRLHRFQFARLAPGVSTSGWAFDTPLTSTEPCIAGKAVDEYSISAGSRIFRICQLDNFRLASAFVISGAASDPSWAFAPGFTLWLGWRRFSDSHRLFVPPTVPATNSRCPTGSSVVVTVRPLNLWMQVQKSSKSVNFTRVGAEENSSLAASVFRLTFARKCEQTRGDGGSWKIGALRFRSAQSGRGGRNHQSRCPASRLLNPVQWRALSASNVPGSVVHPAREKTRSMVVSTSTG